jgi:protein CpxP
MKRTAYGITYPVTLVVVMVVFLSTLFFANANLSFAAAAKKTAPAVARISAVDHTETRIKELQAALKITKAQEELWISLTQVMRENAKAIDALTKERAENAKSMNAVEYMKFHSKINEVQLEQAKKFIPPFEALYASMSDTQKKSTDTIFRTGTYGKSKKK